MGEQLSTPFERKIACPQCLSSFRLTGGEGHLPAVVLCPRCQTSFAVAEPEAASFEPNPEFARSPSEDTPVVQLSDEAISESSLAGEPSAGGFTDEELEDMDSFARSLRAQPAGADAQPTTDKVSLKPTTEIDPRAVQRRAQSTLPGQNRTPDPEKGRGRERALRARLEQILNEGIDGFSYGDQPPPAITEQDESSQTLRGLPVERDGAPGAGGAGVAGERRGSGFIVLPTNEIREAFGEGVYMLRIAGEEFGPVDESGVVTLIKHGAVMAADEIAEPGGDWLPILQHPGIVRLRSKMAEEAHRVLRGLDVEGRPADEEPEASAKPAASTSPSPATTPPSKAALAPGSPPTDEPAPQASAQIANDVDRTPKTRIDPVSVVLALVVGIAIGWLLAQFY